MNKQKQIENLMADTMTEQATEFAINYYCKPFFLMRWINTLLKRKTTLKTAQKTFYVYPPTLAKMEMFSKVINQLEVNEKQWKENPSIEVWRLCNDKTDLICLFIAIAVTRERELLQDKRYLQRTASFIKGNGTAEDFVKLFLLVLQKVDVVNFTNAMLLTRLYRINEPTHKETKGIA